MNSRDNKDLTTLAQVIVQGSFVEWTTYDLLRHASHLGVRAGKRVAPRSEKHGNCSEHLPRRR
jgi:hypothetical protein